MQELTHYIDGAQVKGGSGRFADVMNPATGEVQARVPLASADELNDAVARAAEAQKAWGATNPQRRARVMMKFGALINEHMDELAELVSREHGKTLPDGRGDVQRGLEVVEVCMGAPNLLKGEFMDSGGPGIDLYSMRQPLGVVAGITPFNFPAMVPLWMYPMAIACGNTFILKPSEKDPSAAMAVAELLQEAGLPKGVMNVIHGGREAVETLLDAKAVKAISFVGSTPVAEAIYSRGSAAGKRVQALGGAKNHAVALPDADLENAANTLMGAAYGSCGERCMAISVAVCVGDETADRLVETMLPKIAQLKVGPGTDKGLDMGPLVTAEHRDKVLGFIEDGVNAGASLVADGRGLTVAGHEEGYFVGGCLFDNVTADMRIYQEEIFGPVLCVVRVGSLDDAMQLINDHEYGNGTAIFTRDGDAARQFCENIQVGMVGVNVPIPVPMAFHSFGGWKRSLFGPLHVHGPDGVRFYTRMKTMTSRWPTGIRKGSDFSMPIMK